MIDLIWTELNTGVKYWGLARYCYEDNFFYDLAYLDIQAFLFLAAH